jgi:GNAT superfamily N-acetyltransferase
MIIRTTTSTDTLAVSAMLEDLVATGKRTSPADPQFVLQTYITNPNGIRCSLAVDTDGTVLGLQSLIRATEGNKYGTPVGWGIIGTHVSPSAARKGVGSTLFETTRAAALEAGLGHIEAYIGSLNMEAQAYYEKMGFRTYRETEVAVCKRWTARVQGLLPRHRNQRTETWTFTFGIPVTDQRQARYKLNGKASVTESLIFDRRLL